MTRTFDTMVHCPNCGIAHSAETAIERWIRKQERLDSRIEGIVRFDCDILLHRYKLRVDKMGATDTQCVMFIEVKTHGAEPSLSQTDTLSLFSQVLRNRRPNRHQAKKGRHANDHTPPARTWSKARSKSIGLRMFGGHLLQMENESPDDSAWMKWDWKPITVDHLIALLRFEIDPDTLKEIDWRRRTYYDCFNRQKVISFASNDEEPRSLRG